MNLNKFLSNNNDTMHSELIYNDAVDKKSVIAILEKSLYSCTKFYFIVAFITRSGVLLLKDCLKALEQKHISGCILTTDYLCFSEPEALEELQQFSNIKIRIYNKENFHIKGYIFEYDNSFTYLIGSSNLTQNALKANKEWNVKLNCQTTSSFHQKTYKEFEKLWQNSQILTIDWLEEYKKHYKKVITSTNKGNIFTNTAVFHPNIMQQKALTALKNLRHNKENKALLISATGTGKTILSALDVKSFKPQRLLFIAHREQLLKQAETSFKLVLGNNINSGFLTGQQKNYSANYLFASINMLGRADVLKHFTPTHFDYIIIDESHRSGAPTYQQLIAYFKPQFILGMTATPNRTDNFIINKLFDYNIAYEIRLQEAMQENLLCPFHYFGIADIKINNKTIDDNSAFTDLTATARVNHIIDKARFYGHSSERVRGLVFCRSVAEAAALSLDFNQQGFFTTALSATDTPAARNTAIKKLEQVPRINGLDYIFSVDIFNEGIDIPAVNQIIMLRPTISPIIFTQQLGRGLRKYNNKDYVVILDFIGNYNNNFMIPIALFGDTSYNKDNLRRVLTEGKQTLYGASTVSFDAIAQKRIYDAIDTARLSDTALLKRSYEDLKHKLNHIPSFNDFSNFGSIDILKYIEKFGSYHTFLQKYEPAYNIKLNEIEEEILLYISKRFAAGKRILETAALILLINNPNNLFIRLENFLQQNYQLILPVAAKTSLINNLTNKFTIKNEQEKYQHCIFIKNAGTDYSSSEQFQQCLQNPLFKHKLLSLLNFAQERYTNNYQQHYNNTCLCLYQKYTYEEVCYLLNWPHKINPNAMAGYFYEKTTHTMPVFINYIPADKKRVAYTNEFLSNQQITAYSKLNRKLDSTDAQHIYNATTEKNKIYLFIRKPYEDKNSKEFYFLGEITAVGQPVSAPEFNGFKTTYELADPVRDDIFNYLTS
ncbi:DUF3427 domain-containing protein [Pectinatus brassicae]|uniref:Superfamily II DNA or RNA helicase n=1 Tax=Pectinatus brassicae TaxID=862415 RepID=A0A840UMA3_9FIRM|nr:DUF3427 domain-containing protein [Pectinatus brassicae]MBB5335382.1 superfamily II DNA or RNA helicase [Pectinatus brassicae]